MRMLTLGIALLFSTAASAQTADLKDILQAALSADPEWAAAQRTWEADQQYRVQGRAALFPTIQASYNLSRTHRDIENQPALDTLKFTSETAGISLLQPLFRVDAWYGNKQLQAITNAAEAQYLVEQQGFLIRAASHYIEVLRAWEVLESARAEERALSRQREQTQERFDVGLVPITDVEEARAAYDLASVGLIMAETSFEVARDNLASLTGQNWESLSGLQEDLPMNGPQPADPDHWVEQAQANNLQLKAARAQADSARSNARVKAAGQLPQVNLYAQYQHGHVNKLNSAAAGLGSIDNDHETKVAGIEVTMPLFAGGALNSQRREASFRHQAAEEQYRLAWRNVHQTALTVTRQLTASARNVQARKQALRSMESALRATESGYEVGTRNVVDVLNAQRNFHASQRDYASARYDYILGSLQLKAVAGQLNEQDIYTVNSWLGGEAVPLQQ